MNTSHTTETEEKAVSALDRRRFLNLTGVALAAGAVLLAGCKKDDEDQNVTPATPSDDDPNAPVINLTNDETGLLNYLYVIEQLHAGFLEKVVSIYPDGFTPLEKEYFLQMRDQQIAHRGFLTALLGNNITPAATLNFSAVTFTSRASVLSQAKTFADLAEAAYNGAAEFFTTPATLELMCKIASVESRQAAYISNLVQSGSFAAPAAVDPNGLVRLRKPSLVLIQINPFIRNKITSSLS